VSHLNFDHLRPPKGAFSLVHDENYILEIRGKEYIRRIFHNVQYTQHEKDKLADFEEAIEKDRIVLPNDWKIEDTMKYAYSGKFDIKKSLTNLKAHLAWRAQINKSGPTDRSLRLLRNGVVYISGRDKDFRPIIIVNADKITYSGVNRDDYNDSLLSQAGIEDFTGALCFVLSVAKEFYMVPGRVENWVIMAETSGLGFEDVPFKVFKTIIDVTSINFVGMLDKLYIMNPSKAFKNSWNLIQSMIDPLTVSKVTMIKRSQHTQLLKTIAPEQLEERYGGLLGNPRNYWPPVNTFSKSSNPQFRHEDTANTRDPGEMTEGSKNLTSTAYLTMKDVELKLTRSTKTSVNHGSTIDWVTVKENYMENYGGSHKETDDCGQSTNYSQSKGERQSNDKSTNDKSSHGDSRRRSQTMNAKYISRDDDNEKPRRDWSVTKIDYRVGYEDYEEYVEEVLSEEEEKEEWEEGQKVHVSSYQSLRKYSHLSTVKEETYEEGLTSLMSQGTNGRKTKAKSKRSLMSSVLLRNASEKLEKIATYTGAQSGSNSGSGTGSNNTASNHSKLKLGLSRAAFTDSIDMRSELGSEERRTNNAVCCRWPGFGGPMSTNASTNSSKSRHNESCNIF